MMNPGTSGDTMVRFVSGRKAQTGPSGCSCLELYRKPEIKLYHKHMVSFYAEQVADNIPDRVINRFETRTIMGPYNI